VFGLSFACPSRSALFYLNSMLSLYTSHLFAKSPSRSFSPLVRWHISLVLNRFPPKTPVPVHFDSWSSSRSVYDSNYQQNRINLAPFFEQASIVSEAEKSTGSAALHLALIGRAITSGNSATASHRNRLVRYQDKR
jgi:hypothetical protein